MTVSESTTRWIGKSLVPTGRDVGEMERAARGVRDLPVAFDWFFTRSQLEDLRRTAYEWGSGITGRFRRFDARVLRAINAALDEPQSSLTLSEPTRAAGKDWEIRCTPANGGYRLAGSVTFDVVAGYAVAAFSDEWRSRLGTAANTVTSAVSQLGWDLEPLKDPQYRAVRNRLFGVAIDSGIQEEIQPTGEPLDVSIHFAGPFSAIGDAHAPSLFTDPCGRRAGVYLWTLPIDGENRAWYIGQTGRSFSQRMAEHLSGFLCGEYAVPDVAALLAGRHSRANREGDGVSWPDSLPSHLRQLGHLSSQVTELVKHLRFHLAPVEGDRLILERIEGTIGRHFMRQDTRIRDFFAPGIKLPARVPGVRLMRLKVSSDVPIAGLPSDSTL